MGNDVSRPSSRLKAALVGLACVSQVTAFAPVGHCPATVRSEFAKPCPQFVYLQEDGDQQLPLAGEHQILENPVPNVNQDFVIPPPSLDIDDAWMAEMELEMEMQLGDFDKDFGDEEMEALTKVETTGIDLHQNPSNGIKTNGASLKAPALNSDQDDLGDDVLSPVRMQFEAISKNLDAALEELVDDFDSTTKTKTESKLHFITESLLSNSYNDNGNDNDDGDDDDDDSTASLYGQAVDSLVHSANTIELPFFASLVDKSKRTKQHGELELMDEIVFEDMGRDVELVKNEVSVSSNTRPAFAFQRSLLEARLNMEQKAKDYPSFGIMPTNEESLGFIYADDGPSSEENKEVNAPLDQRQQERRLVNGHGMATDEEQLAIEALRNAQDEEKVQLSRLEEIQELAKQAVRLNEEKRRLTSELPTIANETKMPARRFDKDTRRTTKDKVSQPLGRPTFIIQSGKKDSQAQHDLPSLRTIPKKPKVGEGGRPTHIIQKPAIGSTQTDERLFSRVHDPNPPKEPPQTGRPTHIIQQSILEENGPPKDAPPDAIDIRPDKATTVSLVDSKSQTDVSSSVIRSFSPVEGLVALKESKDGIIIKSVATHVSKAAFFGSKTAFLTLGGLFESAMSPEVAFSMKAASESISSTVQSFSEAISNATGAERYSILSGTAKEESVTDLETMDLLLEATKGFGSVVASVGSVSGTFLRNFFRSTNSIEALAAAADTTNECVSLLTSILALGMKQGDRATSYYKSTGKEMGVTEIREPLLAANATNGKRSSRASANKPSSGGLLEMELLSSLQDFVTEQFRRSQSFFEAPREDITSKVSENQTMHIDVDDAKVVKAPPNPMHTVLEYRETHVGRSQSHFTKVIGNRDKPWRDLGRDDTASTTNTTGIAGGSNLPTVAGTMQEKSRKESKRSPEHVKRDIQQASGSTTRVAGSETSFECSESKQQASVALAVQQRELSSHLLVEYTPNESTTVNRQEPGIPAKKGSKGVLDRSAEDTIVDTLRSRRPNDTEVTTTDEKRVIAPGTRKVRSKEANLERTSTEGRPVAMKSNGKQAASSAATVSMDDTNSSAVPPKQTAGKNDSTRAHMVRTVATTKSRNISSVTDDGGNVDGARTNKLVTPKTTRVRDDPAVELFRSLFHF